MPRLPFGIADPQLPQTSGRRGGTVGVPVVQDPGLDADAATLPGRALGDMGTQVARTGQYLEQAEGYQFQRQRAQDVLDSTLAFQEYLQQYQPAIVERSKGDYRELPKDVRKLGKDLAGQVALERRLSPQAKALFQEKAESAITKAQADALEVHTKRFQQDTLFSVTREVQQVQQAAASARDEGELMIHLGRLEGTLMQGIPVGLWDGASAAKMYRDTELLVRKDRAARAIWGDPVGRFQELQAMSQGGIAKTPALQNLPTQLVEPLLTEAAQRVGEVTRLREAERRVQAEQVKQVQDQNAIQLTARLYEVHPVPQNQATIDATIKQIREAGLKGYLEKNEYQQLLREATAYGEKARTYVAKDDPVVDKELRILLANSETQDELRAFKLRVEAEQHSLTGTTYGTLKKEAEARMDRLHPLNQDMAKQARQRILDYLGITPGSPAPIIAQRLRQTSDINGANALLALQSALVAMTPAQVEQQALGLADQIIQTYIQDPDVMTGPQWLSRPLQTGFLNKQVPPNAWFAAEALKRVPGMTDAEKWRQLQEYEAWATSKRGKAYLDYWYVNPETPEARTRRAGGSATSPAPPGQPAQPAAPAQSGAQPKPFGNPIR